MGKMKAAFTAVSTMVLREKSGTHSTFESVEIKLYLSKNLDPSAYFNKDGSRKAASVKPTTQCFVQGLLANLHAAHQHGLWDSADHLRYIIQQLEHGFVKIAKVAEGEPY